MEHCAKQVVTDDYAIYQGDACELIKSIPDGSIHYGCHSPPFIGLYKFSNSERDISNSEGDTFWQHYGFLISELYRVTRPHRIHSVHCMQLPTSKTRHGYIGMQDFRGDVIRAYCGDEAENLTRAIGVVLSKIAELEEEGEVAGIDRLRELLHRWWQEREEAAAKAGRWIFHSEVCIWKDPVIAQQRTKSIRLLHKQILKDSTISGMGLADYIVSFRKPGENEAAVAGPFDEWAGDDSLDVSPEAYDRHRKITEAEGRKAWPFETWRSILIWQRYASPVWSDIDQTRTLQNRKWNPVAQDERDEKDEQHISPLQLDVIERCCQLWSLPGETVLTPFLGIGSEVYVAAQMGRRGVGFELKDTYFDQAARNLAAMEKRKPDDLLSVCEAA
jgi:DNA modification methylase